MSKGARITLAVLGILAVFVIVLALLVFRTYVDVWNGLNARYQGVEGGKSLYSAALNTCTEKIEGVWTIANQYLDHESKTFKGVAEARSGYLTAKKAFETGMAEGKGLKELTKDAMVAGESARALLALNVQIEAYPALKGVEASREAMRGLEEGVEQIKTALDDWIVSIRSYNTYRNSFWPNVYAGFMGGKFPTNIEYYEGEVKKLDISDLDPQAKERKQ